MARDKRKRCASGVEDDCQAKVTPPKKKQNRLPAELMLHFIETAHNEGVPSAARAFDVPSTTAYRIVHKWRPSTGFASVQRQKTGPKAGRARKLTSEVKDWILQQSAADNTLSGPQLATKLTQELNITLHPATINKVLASNRITFKRTTVEAIERNRPELIEERAQFAQAMLLRRLRPDDASAIVYWDECYFETNIIARRARAPKGKPAVVKQAHRGVYFPKDKAKKQDKSKEDAPQVEENLITEGTIVNSLALCLAVTGTEVLMARTQYRHFTAEDVVGFFKELLDKLNRAYPNKSCVFIGDNLGLHKSILPLFERDENKRHSFIPNPRSCPFLNASEYVFSQIKRQVLGQPYKRLRDLTEAVHQSAFGLNIWPTTTSLFNITSTNASERKKYTHNAKRSQKKKKSNNKAMQSRSGM